MGNLNARNKPRVALSMDAKSPLKNRYCYLHRFRY